jgi:hypothetical protein
MNTKPKTEKLLTKESIMEILDRAMNELARANVESLFGRLTPEKEKNLTDLENKVVSLFKESKIREGISLSFIIGINRDLQCARALSRLTTKYTEQALDKLHILMSGISDKFLEKTLEAQAEELADDKEKENV